MSDEASFRIQDAVTEIASARGSRLGASSSADVGDKLHKDEIERLVQKTLESLQQKCQFADANTLMSLVVPKVLYDLHGFDHMHEELDGIKQSLHSYTQHSAVIDEDIAEIFLDLHNIYKKLDKLDARRSKALQDTKFKKRLQEAEGLLQSSKHYIDNEESSVSVITVALDSETSRQSEGSE